MKSLAVRLSGNALINLVALYKSDLASTVTGISVYNYN